LLFGEHHLDSSWVTADGEPRLRSLNVRDERRLVPLTKRDDAWRRRDEVSLDFSVNLSKKKNNARPARIAASRSRATRLICLLCDSAIHPCRATAGSQISSGVVAPKWSS